MMCYIYLVDNSKTTLDVIKDINKGYQKQEFFNGYAKHVNLGEQLTVVQFIIPTLMFSPPRFLFNFALKAKLRKAGYKGKIELLGKKEMFTILSDIAYKAIPDEWEA